MVFLTSSRLPPMPEGGLREKNERQDSGDRDGDDVNDREDRDGNDGDRED